MLELYEYLSGLTLGPDVYVLSATASGGGRQPVVKVVVDTPSGITIDEITAINRFLRKDEILAQQVGSTEFRLEVTSPGVDAGLKEPWQFERHVGQRLRVQWHSEEDSEDEVQQVEGRLVKTGTDGIVLNLAGREQALAWKQIIQAIVQLDW
jgi:ribosome maturation factor RimP